MTSLPVSLTDLPAIFRNACAVAFSRPCLPLVILPVIINLLLLTLGGTLLVSLASDYIYAWAASWPQWLQFAAWVLTAITLVITLMASCYCFSFLAAIIASPFYGLLAERAEQAMHGSAPEDLNFAGMLREIPRIITREMQKQLYFLPRLLLIGVVFIIPVLDLTTPFWWFLLSAAMGCLQFCDFAYDNHRISFPKMRADLRRSRVTTLVFGAIVAFLMAVPVVSFFIQPIAVCAGVDIYLRQQRSRVAPLE